MSPAGKHMYDYQYFLKGLVLMPFIWFSTSLNAAPQEPLVAAPRFTADPLSSGYLVQLTLGLIIVLLGILLLAWVVRRYTRFQSAAGGNMRVLGGLTLGARERVVLVQVGKTQMLLGVAPGRVQKIHVLDEPLEAAGAHEDEHDPSGFATRLQEVLKRRQAS